jgi:hypothetical protein
MERDAESLTVCHTQPDGKLGSVGTTFRWSLVSRYGGMNEAGLAIASASTAFENPEPGIIINIATRWVLDNCETTEDAVAFLETMTKVWGETYIIVDKNNTIAKVESHRKKTVTTYSDSGFAYTTLLYDAPEMKRLLSSKRMINCSEIHSTRKEFLDNWFVQNKGKISNELIIDALKDHENAICYHGLEGLEICWSYILEPTEQNAIICQGRPCKNDYIDMKFDFS